MADMSVSPTLRFPDAVDAQTRSVRLRDVTRESLAAAAFLDDRWDRAGCAAQSVPLAELVPDGPGARPVFIWHTAFCCSTLLARCLDKPGRNLSLREPAALMEVANIKRRDGVAVSDLWLRGLLPSLAASAGTDACVTIKPTNTVNNLIADTARLFPQARHLFLTSSLRAFLTSLAKKGEAGRSFARRLFTIFAMDGHPVARSDPRQLMQMSDLQIAAIVWHMQIATLQAALAQGPAAAFASLDGDAFVAAPAAALTAVDGFLALSSVPRISPRRPTGRCSGRTPSMPGRPTVPSAVARRRRRLLPASVRNSMPSLNGAMGCSRNHRGTDACPIR